jgi:hypothetical protein
MIGRTNGIGSLPLLNGQNVDQDSAGKQGMELKTGQDLAKHACAKACG